MAHLILIYGPPGAGRSTYARRLAEELPRARHIESSGLIQRRLDPVRDAVESVVDVRTVGRIGASVEEFLSRFNENVLQKHMDTVRDWESEDDSAVIAINVLEQLWLMDNSYYTAGSWVASLTADAAYEAIAEGVTPIFPGSPRSMAEARAIFEATREADISVIVEVAVDRKVGKARLAQRHRALDIDYDRRAEEVRTKAEPGFIWMRKSRPFVTVRIGGGAYKEDEADRAAAEEEAFAELCRRLPQRLFEEGGGA